MKFLIVLAFAVSARAFTYFPQDAPDVAAAKAAHFAEHAKAAARVGAPLQDVYKTTFFNPLPTHFAAPFATPVVTPEGFIADTPEVAAAKAAHLAEHAKAAAAAPGHFLLSDPYDEYYRAYYNHYYPSYTHPVYTGPQAVPTVLPNGYLADTPEVAHAKAAHLYRLYQEYTRQ